MAALVLSIQVSESIADFKAYTAGDEGMQDDLEQSGKQSFIPRRYIIAGNLTTFVRLRSFLSTL